ncbi:hypothetical protein BDZ91DRAFT_484605 [Kalaharituber pfeilii]|nr:hypothetical protein BDZ91DRAFT_484605 [Kalaharituber pfeilii]
MKLIFPIRLMYDKASACFRRLCCRSQMCAEIRSTSLGCRKSLDSVLNDCRWMTNLRYQNPPMKLNFVESAPEGSAMSVVYSRYLCWLSPLTSPSSSDNEAGCSYVLRVVRRSQISECNLSKSTYLLQLSRLSQGLVILIPSKVCMVRESSGSAKKS